jgi:hypothetical protein
VAARGWSLLRSHGTASTSATKTSSSNKCRDLLPDHILTVLLLMLLSLLPTALLLLLLAVTAAVHRVLPAEEPKGEAHS